jgi:hypothetical protein
MSSLTDRLQQARSLWEELLSTGYLDRDPGQRTFEQIEESFEEIQTFLDAEERQYNPTERNSAVIIANYLELLWVNSGQIKKTSQEYWLGRASRFSGDLIIKGKSYALASEPYSSIYAALLAILLDEATIQVFLRNIVNALRAGNLCKPPDETQQDLLNLARYRGQRKAWQPVPKMSRSDFIPMGRFRVVRALVAMVKQIRAQKQFVLAVCRERPDLVNLSAEEWNAVCQHYGFPTQLLDFTTSLEVAAFFATAGARTDDIGAIYRLHPLDLYCTEADAALFVAAGKYTRVEDHDVRDRWENFHENRRSLSNLTRSQVQEVEVPSVPRIARQKGLFIQGFRADPARQFLQLIRFRHHNGVVYEEPLRNISSSWLLPTDDPIDKVSRPFLSRLGLG